MQAPWIANPPEDNRPSECRCGTMTRSCCHECEGRTCPQCCVDVGDQLLCGECYYAWLGKQPCDEDEVSQ